ncbi:hypothetical protein CMV_015498 [Castanea mollissima]|uniref:Uncharacterized protein n=1 Tax=Castanea mollissima TaxID=60419 RepID=A0A8J4VFY7_9ROSI|nr:hypothetical protein CMV_015498 [Castanea mollissima]
MKGVEYLHLQGNCTNELPPSFGNLIGLKHLVVSPHLGEAHLPSRIYNLQSIERLELSCNIIFPKNVEIDRQPIVDQPVSFDDDFEYDFDYVFYYHVVISINGSERTFESKSIEIDRSSGLLCFSCRRQSSLQELFRDLQLTDRNHVQILCNFDPPGEFLTDRNELLDIHRWKSPIVKKIGVHVECNCPPPQNHSIFQDINRPLYLQSDLGLLMDTENGSDLLWAFDSSDGNDLGSSSVAQLVTPQISTPNQASNLSTSFFPENPMFPETNLTKDDIKIWLVKMDFSLYLHYDILRSDAEKDDCKSSKRHSYCVSVFCFFALRHFCIKKEYGFK